MQFELDHRPVFDGAGGRIGWHSPRGERHIDIQVSEERAPHTHLRTGYSDENCTVVFGVTRFALVTSKFTSIVRVPFFADHISSLRESTQS